MRLKADGVICVRWLEDGTAVLHVMWKGIPRRTIVSRARAEQAIRETPCISYDTHNRRK